MARGLFRFHSGQSALAVIYRSSLLLAICLVAFSLIADAIAAPVANRGVRPFAETTDKEDGEKESAESGPDEADQETAAKQSFIGNMVTLGLLILLQAVLGFDNLLYITLESKNAPEESQRSVRAWGIGLAIGLRIALLFLLVYLKEYFEQITVFEFAWPFAEGHFSIHSLIVLAGGAFIIYTAVKEIWHMTRLEHDHYGESKIERRSVGSAIFWIVVMNVVFSFDSILSAMALTEVFWVMAAAIVLSGVAMIWLSDRVADFLARNRMYEVLGLFVLFVVGIMLVSEGGHLAHLQLFGNAVMPMTKTTFYFVLAVLVLTDIVQGRYQRKLLAGEPQSL